MNPSPRLFRPCFREEDSFDSQNGDEQLERMVECIKTDVELEQSGCNAEDNRRKLRHRPSFYTPDMEDKMRRKLKFFFMDPCKKWTAKRRLPWKMFFQILKIVAITVQLCIFGYERGSFVDYVERNTIALKHLFLKKWDPSFETLPYPPATGEYALYQSTDLYEHINFAVKQYENISKIAIGAYHIMHRRNSSGTPPMHLCKTYYFTGKVFDNGTFIYDSKIKYNCFEILPVRCENGSKVELCYDILKYMREINESIDLDRLLKIQLKFSLQAVRLDLQSPHRSPLCFKMKITITFDNSDRDGQMRIYLVPQITEMICMGKVLFDGGELKRKRSHTIYDAFVIILSIASACLCLRSIWRAQVLKEETVRFFCNHFNKKLSVYDQLEFLNMWYILIIVNDCLTIIGSAFKIQLENRNAESTSKNFDICGLMLGTGSLLVWFGALRYLGFFKKYNILILTLKRASPNVMRFLVCTLMMYSGFTFCGWVVLGPYHIKFRQLSTTSECLFSLINGDDMFVTFTALQTSNTVIWYYSRVYLYGFISLFIYVVLSLFIAVIMDTYETIKNYYERGFPKSDLFEFIDQCTDPPNSSIYRQEAHGCSIFSSLCLCCKMKDSDHPSEHARLLS